MTQVQKLRARSRSLLLLYVDCYFGNLSLSLIIAWIPEGLFCYAMQDIPLLIYMELLLPL